MRICWRERMWWRVNATELWRPNRSVCERTRGHTKLRETVSQSYNRHSPIFSSCTLSCVVLPAFRSSYFECKILICCGENPTQTKMLSTYYQTNPQYRIMSCNKIYFFTNSFRIEEKKHLTMPFVRLILSTSNKITGQNKEYGYKNPSLIFAHWNT